MRVLGVSVSLDWPSCNRQRRPKGLKFGFFFLDTEERPDELVMKWGCSVLVERRLHSPQRKFASLRVTVVTERLKVD